VGSFAVAGAQDVDDAVRAARRGFDEGPWPRTRAGERIRVLHACAAALREQPTSCARCRRWTTALPLSFASVYATSVGVAADVFEHHAGWVDKIGGQTLPPFQGGDHLAMTFANRLVWWPRSCRGTRRSCCSRRRWHRRWRPLHGDRQAVEHATFTVAADGHAAAGGWGAEGALQVVTGPGEPTGQALISHPGVDKVSFTGSRAVGRG